MLNLKNANKNQKVHTKFTKKTNLKLKLINKIFFANVNY